MNISVIGLGKLGLCTAGCLAFKGHKVIGVDCNKKVIQDLQSGLCPIDETGLPRLLHQSRANMTFTTDYAEAIFHSDATLIIVPTPSLQDGSFSNEYILAVLQGLAPALNEKKNYHILDIVSTVMPTSCDQVFRPFLERLIGKTCGKDFGLVYNPEFIALGSVIRDFLNPDMVLIGASDERSGCTIRDLYDSIVDSRPTYAVMSLINAEIAKLSLNCYVTMKISFANELAAICEKVYGADVDEVTKAIGADSRVGSKCLKGGLGFGGPCFPRDNQAFQRFSQAAGISALLSSSVVAANNGVLERIERIIVEKVAPGKIIALLGIAYKSGTQIVEKSQPLMLANRLNDKGYKVRLYDPKALPVIDNKIKNKFEFFSSPYSAAKDAKAIVLLTNWPEFKNLDWQRIKDNSDNSSFLLDSWRIFKDGRFVFSEYFGLGYKSIE